MPATRIDRGSTETTTVFTEGPELVMERVFDATRELIWKVMTDPERITDWWGPNGSTVTVETMDVRPGGAWRFIEHSASGEDNPFRGEYLEVVPPERVVQTFIYDVEGFRDMAAIETMILEDLGDRTKVVNRSRYPSAEILEGALSTGMVGGALQTWDRLAAAVAKAKSST